MPFITITSDWNQGDYYLSALKGKLYSLIPDVTIVDISQNILPHNYRMAAFILRNSYRAFPKNTIHLMCLNTIASNDSPHVAIYHKGHFFIGADNGIFSLMFDEPAEKGVYIEHSAQTTFPEYDIFADAAAYIANGGNLDALGSSYQPAHTQGFFFPTFHEGIISGIVLYIDSYGNLISNISKNYFSQKIQNNKFEIQLDWGYYKINTIAQNYYEVLKGDLCALFNSLGMLEIALIGGSASEILNIHEEDEIVVKILNSEE
jgi:S-adenosylmethionine hydrolase